MRVTSAGRGLLKKEPSAVPSSYPASGYFVIVRAEKHFERVLYSHIIKAEIPASEN